VKDAIVKAALFTPTSRARWGLAVYLRGEPGAAKTSFLVEVGEAWGLDVEVLSPGERGEGAFGVVPVPERRSLGARAERTVLTYPAPEWAERFLAPGARGLVVVDELPEAPHHVRPALLGLLADRRVGGVTLGPGVRVVAAGNDPDEVQSGYDLPAHVANRVGHVAWDPPTVAEHEAYMSRGFGPPPPVRDAGEEERRVLAAWPDAYAWAVQLESGFLRARPSLKNLLPGGAAAQAFEQERGPDNKPVRPKCKLRPSGPWPSDRSWEHATRSLASARVHGLSLVDREEFVGAFVSEPVAGEWFTWVERADLPDPAGVLDGRVAFVHDPARVDRTSAVFAGCVALVSDVRSDRRKERVRALWELIAEHGRRGRDLDLGWVAWERLVAGCRDPDRTDGVMVTHPTGLDLARLYKGLAGVVGHGAGGAR
jgi:MoxR-like ATPase